MITEKTLTTILAIIWIMMMSIGGWFAAIEMSGLSLYLFSKAILSFVVIFLPFGSLAFYIIGCAFLYEKPLSVMFFGSPEQIKGPTSWKDLD